MKDKSFEFSCTFTAMKIFKIVTVIIEVKAWLNSKALSIRKPQCWMRLQFNLQNLYMFYTDIPILNWSLSDHYQLVKSGYDSTFNSFSIDKCIIVKIKAMHHRRHFPRPFTIKFSPSTFGTTNSCFKFFFILSKFLHLSINEFIPNAF